MSNSEAAPAAASTAARAPIAVQVRPVTAFEVTVNGKQLSGLFVQEDAMDGIKRLTSHDSDHLRTVIVMEMQTSLAAELGRAIGLPMDTMLLKASPAVFEEAGLLGEPKA